MALRSSDLALVALGGALGAMSRYAVGTAVPHPGGTWPWATFSVNVTASLAIGVLAGWAYWRHTAHWVRPLLMTGFLGGFSTYSTFAVDTVSLAAAGSGGLAAAYVIVTLLVCVIAVGLGTVVAQAVWRDA
ncbi:fluoride efflux transporter FluC [Knoellia sp. Soil729]|uniref:fluoride efflux transporter FluC n=1 Tax=Knoellia sp. Soil729 TaxID=1736394 RepID=UPI000A4C0306|nr:CrcB family protein [Knoellia sp. Soil729]